MKQHEEGYAMPLSAPSYTVPPFESTARSQILLVLYQGDRDAVAWEVPEPLEPPSATAPCWPGSAICASPATPSTSTANA